MILQFFNGIFLLDFCEFCYLIDYILKKKFKFNYVFYCRLEVFVKLQKYLFFYGYMDYFDDMVVILVEDKLKKDFL